MMHCGQESGVVMVVTLLLLLVLSIMGLSAVSNATMEERMSGNFLHQALAHQAAESAISTIVLAADPSRNAYSTEKDPLARSERADSAGVTVEHLHGTAHELGLQVNSLSVVTYHSGLGCHRYEVTTEARLSGSGTRVSHLQGLVRIGPRGTQ